MAKIGLRYAEEEGGLISIIIPDDDAELDRIVLPAGQALAKVERAAYEARAAAKSPQERHRVPHEMLQEITGKEPPDSRLVLVDDETDEVRGALVGYPSTLQAPRGRRLVRHRDARPGDRIDRQGRWRRKPGDEPTVDAAVVK